MRLSTARHGGRAAVTTIAAAGLVIGALVSGANSASAAPGDPGNPAPAAKASADKGPAKAGKSNRGQLSQHNQKLLADAQAAKQDKVTVLIATDKGQTATVAAQVKGLGGSVSTKVDAVGYVRALVPTSAVTKAVKLPGVAALDLNESIPLEDPRPDAAASKGKGKTPALYPAPGATHAGRQPVHADRRDRLGRLQAGPPEVGRPRHHDRHPRLRRRPRPPGAADDHHRRAQDRRLGHRDRPGPRRRRHLAPDAHRRRPARRSPYAGRHLDRARPAATRSAPVHREPSPRPTSRAATSTATATPPTSSASSTTRRRTTSGSTPNNDGDFTDDAVMRPYKEKLRRRPLRHRQPGHRGRASRCRSSSSTARTSTPRRPAGPARPTSSTSASSRTSTARTSPASPPPTTCSATRTTTARRPAPRSSPRGPAPGAAAAPRPR